MVVTVKKNTKTTEILRALKKQKPRKLFNAKDFVGKVKWGEDALEFQKRIRNEWD